MCWITFCFVSRTINHANNSTSTSYMQRPGTKGGSEGRFLAQLIINVNEKRVYPLCIHWRDGMVFRRGLACCVALNTTDFTPDTYRWNEFLVRGWPAIVTLPFSVLLPNQTGSISLLINFSKATCLVLCLVQKDIRSSNLGLTKSVDQFLFFFFFGRCVVRMVWFNLTHLFLTHLWCYQAVVSLVSLECDEGGNGKYLFLKILCIIYTFNSILFLLFRIFRSKF